MDLCHIFYCIHALHDKLSIHNLQWDSVIHKIMPLIFNRLYRHKIKIQANDNGTFLERDKQTCMNHQVRICVCECYLCVCDVFRVTVVFPVGNGPQIFHFIMKYSMLIACV